MFIKRTDSVKPAQDISLTIGKTCETFNLSIFGEGVVVNDAFQDILKDYDTDGNGRIEGDELKNLKSDILHAAGDDNILDEKELAQLFTKSDKKTEQSERNTALFKAFLICLKNGSMEFSGNNLSSFREDGSGVRVRLFDDFIKGGYRVNIYSKDGIPKELITCTNCDCREGEFNKPTNNNMTSHVIYDDNGNVSEQSCIYPGDDWTSPYTQHTLFEYDESGNLVSKIDKYKDTKTGDTKYTTTKYSTDESVLQTTIITNKNGLSRTEVTNYSGDTILNRQIKQEKDDIFVVEEYDGANLDNRMDYLPSKRTIYDKAAKTVKSTEINNFSAEGILIGKTVEENGKIRKYDYSKPDGVIETSSQGGIGNCFFLETINTLNLSDEGKKILNSMISTDENGDFKVSFGGASKIIEDLNSGIKNFPREKIFIKPDYIITQEEYKDACVRAGKDFSTGDKDVLLLELAYAKYRKDATQTVEENDVNLSLFTDDTKLIAGLDVARGWNVDAEDMGAGGMLGVTMYLFTGKKSDVYFSPSETHNVCHIDSDGNLTAVENSSSSWDTSLKNNESNVFNNRYDDIEQVISRMKKQANKKNGTFKNLAVEVSLPITQQVINGQVVTGGNHAFTVKGITDSKILLVNPWDSSKEVTITIEDFKKSACMINMLTLQS